MWTIIILIVIFIIGKFLYDRNQQSQKVAKEGGMRHKYRVLIEYLMSGDERSKIFQENSDYISFGVSNAGGLTMFSLTQTFGKVTIQWKMDSPVFGKHKLEWIFNEYEDTEKIVKQIANDTSKYQDNMLTANGFSGIDD